MWNYRGLFYRLACVFIAMFLEATWTRQNTGKYLAETKECPESYEKRKLRRFPSQICANINHIPSLSPQHIEETFNYISQYNNTAKHFAISSSLSCEESRLLLSMTSHLNDVMHFLIPEEHAHCYIQPRDCDILIGANGYHLTYFIHHYVEWEELEGMIVFYDDTFDSELVNNLIFSPPSYVAPETKHTLFHVALDTVDDIYLSPVLANEYSLVVTFLSSNILELLLQKIWYSHLLSPLTIWMVVNHDFNTLEFTRMLPLGDKFIILELIETSERNKSLTATKDHVLSMMLSRNETLCLDTSMCCSNATVCSCVRASIQEMLLPNEIVVWNTCHSFSQPTSLWQPGEEVVKPKDKTFEPDNFHQKVFRVATNNYTWFQTKLLYDNGSAYWEGFSFVMMDILKESLNFSYVIEQAPDDRSGSPQPDGSWSGVIGMVVRGESDIAVAALSHTQERSVVVDFTEPILLDPLAMIGKLTKADHGRNNYVARFSYVVWTCVIGALVFTGIWMYVTSRVCRLQGFRHHNTPAVWQSPHETLWYAYGAIVGQGGEGVPSLASVRLFVGAWWGFCVIVTQIYTCDLIAVLSVPSKYTLPAETVDDLAALSTVRACAISGSSHETLLKNSKMASLQRLRNKTDLRKRGLECLALVEKGTHMFLADRTYLERLMQTYCGLAIAREEVAPQDIAFALPKGSPYKKYIDDRITYMKSSGIIQHWKNLKSRSDKKCILTKETGGKPGNLSTVSGAFYILAYGLTASCLMFFLELTYNKVKSRRKNKVKRDEEPKIEAPKHTIPSIWVFSKVGKEEGQQESIEEHPKDRKENG